MKVYELQTWSHALKMSMDAMMGLTTNRPSFVLILMPQQRLLPLPI